MQAPQVFHSEGMQLTTDEMQPGCCRRLLLPQAAGIEKVQSGAEAKFANDEVRLLQPAEARWQVIALQKNVGAFTQRIGFGVVDVAVIQRMWQAVIVPVEAGIAEAGGHDGDGQEEGGMSRQITR